MTTKQNFSQEDLINFIAKNFGEDFGSNAVIAASEEFEVSYPTISKRLTQFKTKHGRWNLSVQDIEKAYNDTSSEPAEQVSKVHVATIGNLIPEKNPNFVSFGNFNDLKKIISSKIFYPLFITGMSGNGKTFSVEQACAQLNRELIRINITIETDEDDLIGGFRLINGETVWHNGPVIEALERGAVLLLDEIDLASNKIMCLQSILEGTGLFLKKTGRYVKPAPGFTVVATANTKGKGSDDGRFIGTNILNEAFLERFALTFEQEYPSLKIEQKILEKLSEELGCLDVEFCEKLAYWAQCIRKSFKEGALDEVISTRRLIHIIRAYRIFGKRMKAIQVCVNRFDDLTKSGFLQLYDKIDASVADEISEQTISEDNEES